jgi:hypothetical protein
MCVLTLFQRSVQGQFEAALAMLGECIRVCPGEHWERKIAQLTFRQIAYHTLFFTDLYLSPGEEAFALRELHERGGDEREPRPMPGLAQEETLGYVVICREKLTDALAGETAESLAAPSGFSWCIFPRGELYLYNLRHVQHHTGQLSAYLRREVPACEPRGVLPWVSTGWRGA